jgi:hypothetical protein
LIVYWSPTALVSIAIVGTVIGSKPSVGKAAETETRAKMAAETKE